MTFTSTYRCYNCGTRQQLSFPKGTDVSDEPCPNCEVCRLEWEEDAETLKSGSRSTVTG